MATEISSSLLEQAIVDASALKEAAIKNAESALVGKYADDIKEAVDTLLEAEEDELGLGGGLGEEEPAMDASMPDVPAAMGDGERLCPCPEENQEVVIDFDALRQEIDAEEAGGDAMPGTDDALGGIEEPLGAEEEEEDELALEESVLSQLAAALEEELKVDVKPVPSGTLGGAAANPRDKEELEDAATAQARDTEFAEENKQLKKAVKDLQENMSNATSENKKLASIVRQMSARLTEVNLSNAKLIYKNRVLNSDSLNERQKIKIVEAISGARTTKEAKVIYETLQSTVRGTAEKRSPKSLSEAVTKTSSPFLPRTRNEAQVSNEPALTRMQRLAGIK